MNFEERLIELVKAHPALYSKKDENHKNIYIKEKLWNEISNKLGANVKKSKARWKTLRNTFRVELAKNTNSTGVRRSIWRYFDLMMFLKDEIITETSYNSTKIENPLIIDEVGTAQSESMESMPPKKENEEETKQSQILLDNDRLEGEQNNTIVFMDQTCLDKDKDKNNTTDLMDQFCLEKEERNETAVFMESMVIKIRKANLSCDDLDELQEAILSLINKKLREFRRKKSQNY